MQGEPAAVQLCNLLPSSSLQMRSFSLSADLIIFNADKTTMHDAQVLAEKLAEGLPIEHGMTVGQIQWNTSGVIVQCQGGQQIEADAVIVTVSLGVLKVLCTSFVCLLHCIRLWFFPDVAFALALAQFHKTCIEHVAYLTRSILCTSQSWPKWCRV